MKYLNKYKVFEHLTEEEESLIIDDLNDIFHDVRDLNLEVNISCVRSGKVLGDSLSVEIHGFVTDANLVDFSVPTFKLGDVVESIQRADKFLKTYSYLIQPIFATKITVGGGKHRDDSKFITMDKLENASSKQCSHVSLNWRIPIDYKEMTKRLRGNSDD
jgi:hypothetical protein